MAQAASTRRGKSKLGWIVLGVALGVIAVGLGGAFIFASRGIREVKDLTIGNGGFTSLADGTYTGKYTGVKDHMRDTTVQVTVDGGKVSDIQPVGGNLFKDGKPVEIGKGQTIYDLYGRVIESQSLQVDVISGATLTSKTHLKAVEDAVEQAQEK